jgi:hypothetical protein
MQFKKWILREEQGQSDMHTRQLGAQTIVKPVAQEPQLSRYAFMKKKQKKG